MTDLQNNIVNEIRKHPYKTVEDYAELYNHTPQAYHAIEWLIWNQYIKQNLLTGALSVRGE